MRIGFGVCLVFVTSVVLAHFPQESYIYLDVSADQVSGRYEIIVDDLAKEVPLDTDSDGTITQVEFDNAHQRVYEFLVSRLTFYKDDVPLPVRVHSHDLQKTPLGTQARLKFDIPKLSARPDTLDIEFKVPLADEGSGHKSRLIIENNQLTGVVDNEAFHSLILTPESGRQSFSLLGPSVAEVLWRFLKDGAYHIWIGLDHVLFLIALLLASVIRRTDAGDPVPVENFATTLIYVVKVVTLFTIAHSITLALATLELVQLPATPVEVIIAASIAVAAWHNIRPLTFKSIGWVVFGFGLIHGFGFANVLVPLGLSAQSLVTGLVGFNIGVELGQIAIVLVCLPCLFLIRGWQKYPAVVLRGGSYALIAVAMFWVVERSLGWLLEQPFFLTAFPAS